MRYLLALVLLCVSLVSFSFADTGRGTPDDLKAWEGWVLHGHDEAGCPALAGDATTSVCVWPGRLELRLGADGGKFRQKVTVYAPAPFSLPGDSELFPQNVTVSGEAVPVTLSASKRPRIFLEPGEHLISGRLFWAKRPASVPLSVSTALVNVTVDGAQIENPYVDDGGRLWLTRPQNQVEKTDSLDIEVSRLLTDARPGRVATRITLSVSGKKRRETISNLLLPGTLPVVLKGDLPARMVDGGDLEVDVRPGTWTFRLAAVTHGLLTGFPPYGAPFGTEIWAFDNNASLRLVNLSGVRQVDPERTSLPVEWRSHPAYEVGPKDALALEEVRRGQGDSENRLTLTREVWLDFDGQGATVEDRVTGRIDSRRFLSLPQSDFEPGRMALNGLGQLVSDSGDGRFGVEVQRGEVDMASVSRVKASSSSLLLPQGWNTGFDDARVRVNLPVGFEALALGGAHLISGSVWLERWSLLDFFIILLVAVAAAKLWGALWGGLFLPSLVLLWHQPFSPALIWPVVLLTGGVRGFLKSREETPESVGRIVKWVHSGVLLTLLASSIVYSAHEVRLAIYPQLEKPWAVLEEGGRAMPEAYEMQHEMVQDSAVMERSAKVMSSLPFKELKAKYRVPVSGSGETQTGPALPSWRWHEVRAELGAVGSEHAVSLTLSSPLLTRMLRGLRVGFLLVLLWRVASLSGFRFSMRGSAALLVFCLFPLASPSSVQAQGFPSQALLSELETRLLEKPACFPQCLSLARARIILPEKGEEALRLRLRVEAQAPMAIPLPSGDGSWRILQVKDGQGSPLKVVRHKKELWVGVSEGIHTLVVTGTMERLPLSIRFPLAPGAVLMQAGDAWGISGITDTLTVDGVVRAERLGETPEQSPAMGQSRLGSWFEVVRTLELGLEWRAVTQVMRHGGASGTAQVVEFSLLPGEEIRTELNGMAVEDGRVRLTFSPGVSHHRWSSSLPVEEALKLVASEQGLIAETWNLQADPMWHLEMDGISPSPDGRTGMVWEPRQGEVVTIGFSRFPAVKGEQLTVDSARFVYEPGRGQLLSTLTAKVRATKGAEISVETPLAPFASSASVSGDPVPLPGSGESLVLPVNPGEQQAEVVWKAPEQGGSFLASLLIPRRMAMPELDLKQAVSNLSLTLRMPPDRWILWTYGPRVGPAVLMWSIVAFVILAAVAVSRLPHSPLSVWSWALLGVGLVTQNVSAVLVAGGWFFAMDYRKRKPPESRHAFNAMQVLLAIWTIGLAFVLFDAVQGGLLGVPEMQISGNGSHSHALHWSVDRVQGALPSAGVWSLSVWSFRLVMLVWSLWLALKVVSWVRWSVEVMRTGGVWKKAPKPEPENPMADFIENDS